MDDSDEVVTCSDDGTLCGTERAFVCNSSSRAGTLKACGLLSGFCWPGVSKSRVLGRCGDCVVRCSLIFLGPQYVALLARRILQRLLDFWKIWPPLLRTLSLWRQTRDGSWLRIFLMPFPNRRLAVCLKRCLMKHPMIRMGCWGQLQSVLTSALVRGGVISFAPSLLHPWRMTHCIRGRMGLDALKKKKIGRAGNWAPIARLPSLWLGHYIGWATLPPVWSLGTISLRLILHTKENHEVVERSISQPNFEEWSSEYEAVVLTTV